MLQTIWRVLTWWPRTRTTIIILSLLIFLSSFACNCVLCSECGT
uniref:Uncharacterized protein n=1 Tax=Rhizophora mucronata TaxID=61149 RepID=A0A2P2QNC9_RHIMU